MDKELVSQFLDYGLKRLSAETYARALKRFCDETETTPETLLQMPLEAIEDLTEQFIKRNRNKIAPKYLNVIYNAVKTWLHLNRKIKSRKMFREIKFDKHTRKTRDVALPDKDFIRKLCDVANGLKERLIVVLYGIYGLRPSLIPQITIGDVYHKDITFNQDGTVKLSNRGLMGHKGRIASIYDHEGHTLADWEIQQYKNAIDEKELLVYGLTKTQEDIIKAKIETIKAIIKDFDETQIEMLKRELALGKLTFEQFNQKLNEIAQKSMNTQIEKRFEELFIKMANKHGINNKEG